LLRTLIALIRTWRKRWLGSSARIVCGSAKLARNWRIIMLQNLRFVIEGDCPDCEGYGVIYNSNWTDFRKWRDEWEAANPPPQDSKGFREWKLARKTAEEDWWEDLGYAEGRDYWPSEELECKQCNGTGSVQMAITPEEVRAILGV
jgi:hypothetical protein